MYKGHDTLFPAFWEIGSGVMTPRMLPGLVTWCTSTRVVRVDTVLLAAHRQTVLLRVWCMQLLWT